MHLPNFDFPKYFNIMKEKKKNLPPIYWIVWNVSAWQGTRTKLKQNWSANNITLRKEKQ